MTDLLIAVDRLTQPRVEHVQQRTDTGAWVRTVSIEQPSLFQQLQEAGSGRTSAGSNASKHERAPIDLEAVFLHARYASVVADWCRIVGVKPTRDPQHDLRTWYAATLSDNTFNGTGYTSILTTWAHTIETHFDPPKKFEADQPCPICGGLEHGNEFDGGALRAIEITYRLDDAGYATEERALCRLCRAVWIGGDAIRELAEEMDEKRRAIG